MNNIYTHRDLYGTSILQVVQAAPNCFYCHTLDYLPAIPYPPEEAEAWDSMQWEPGFAPPPWAEFGCYVTADAALQSARLALDMQTAGDDLL